MTPVAPVTSVIERHPFLSLIRMNTDSLLQTDESERTVCGCSCELREPIKLMCVGDMRFS